MSNIKAWWQCKDGHEWQATISHRTARGHGCPKCALDQTSSAPERALVSHLASWLGQELPANTYAIEGIRWPHGPLVAPDFVVRNGPIQLAVEYDGRRFHRSRARTKTDRTKSRMLREAGFVVIRIRESPLPALDKLLDLVLEPTLIYPDRASGFGYLLGATQTHIDQVGRYAFGEDVWSSFLESATRQMTLRL